MLRPEDAPFAGALEALDDEDAPGEHEPAAIAAARTAAAVDARVGVRTRESYHPL
jgi:hypothetical protein